MYRLMNDVADFHVACDVPVRYIPAWPNEDRIALRLKLMKEEYEEELLPAIANRDLVETADAMADLIYVIVGAAIEFGIPLALVWRAVQSANMAKVGPDGKVHRREDGKILKPEGWRPPDIASIIRKAQGLVDSEAKSEPQGG